MGASLGRLLFTAILAAAISVWTGDRDLVAGQTQPQPTVVVDLVLGTWHLNIEKSKFNPGPAPKSQTRTYEQYRDGIKTTIRAVYSDGHTSLVQFVSDYSGDQVPV